MANFAVRQLRHTQLTMAASDWNPQLASGLASRPKKESGTGGPTAMHAARGR